MIRLERAGTEDLETIIAIQRASFKAVYEQIPRWIWSYLEDRERIKWKLVERPNSYYYFVKEDEEKIGFTNSYQWRVNGSLVGDPSDSASYQGKKVWI